MSDSMRRWMVLAALTLSSGPLVAAVVQEDFASDPLLRGWHIFGDASLFQWNSANGTLEVTWDSSRTNSYFYHPLGMILGRNHDFTLSFNLRVDEVGIGLNNKEFAFPIVVGFLNLDDATRANFKRGTGNDSPNLVEFDYFRDSGYGATIWPLFVATNSQFNFNGPNDYTIAELATGVWYHVAMQFTASNRTMATTITRDGTPVGPIHDVTLGETFTDFRVDTVSITSFSDLGDDWSSVLARGAIDNLAVVAPSPIERVAGNLQDDTWETRFSSRLGWSYALERTVDWSNWTVVSSVVEGNGEELFLSDLSPPLGGAFYRVRAQRKP